MIDGFSLFKIIMAEGKKSFVLYADLIKSIEHLTNEEKGVLFNHLLEYYNTHKNTHWTEWSHFDDTVS